MRKVEIRWDGDWSASRWRAATPKQRFLHAVWVLFCVAWISAAIVYLLEVVIA